MVVTGSQKQVALKRNMTTKSSKLTYYVVHGFMGGRLHSQKLQTDLKAEGYQPAKDLLSADIVVVHSGGYVLLPTKLNAKILVFVGASLPQVNPKGTFALTLSMLWREAINNGYVLQRVLWNIA